LSLSFFLLCVLFDLDKSFNGLGYGQTSPWTCQDDGSDSMGAFESNSECLDACNESTGGLFVAMSFKE
jgi:hypothetical protein